MVVALSDIVVGRVARVVVVVDELLDVAVDSVVSIFDAELEVCGPISSLSVVGDDRATVGDFERLGTVVDFFTTVTSSLLPVLPVVTVDSCSSIVAVFNVLPTLLPVVVVLILDDGLLTVLSPSSASSPSIFSP